MLISVLICTLRRIDINTIDIDEVMRRSSEMTQLAVDSFYDVVCNPDNNPGANLENIENYQLSFLSHCANYLIDSKSENDMDLRCEGLMLAINSRANTLNNYPKKSSLYTYESTDMIKIEGIFESANLNVEKLNSVIDKSQKSSIKKSGIKFK